jgi:hypothetical protein
MLTYQFFIDFIALSFKLNVAELQNHVNLIFNQ